MNMKELATKNRSYRRFQESEPISAKQLEALVELARLSASAGNLQPLKFILSCEPVRNQTVFSCLAWESFIRGAPGPAEGRRPAAYIVILGDTSITKGFSCDHGIAAQSILFGAVEMGFGGNMFADIDRQKLAASLKIPDQYEILLVIALGMPRERIVITDAVKGEIAYWQDINGVHRVPIRGLNEIILNL
ncbi:MAG: oxygen-insensitive nitroreductase / dihydropteridine reductase [Deltaproteobacteria bacterium]|nr:oxygen-insensitive nitroreductase / dihydropteridine reductase [Deltaproteobacteria bacterium]